MKNIHVHKGPTIWPLDKDSFDVADVDYAATNFTDLNFIVEHVGMPRIEDFCWIGVQEPNVYGGLAVLMPFIHPRPKYFGDVMAELLFWLGEDRLLFASDYALWHPKWLIEKFVDFDLPEQTTAETGVSLSVEAKQKILGLNACKLYDIDPVEHGARLKRRRVRQEGGHRARPAGRGRAGRGGHGMTVSVAAVWEAIDGVIDPELDRSLVELEFVRSVEVGGGDVHVALRLPTYWCSPNFAYLMVGDAHEAVRRVPGAERVRIDLVDHYAGERISEAIQAGLSFQEAFPDQAEGELHELRRKFRLKAFVVRQEPVLRAVRLARRRRRRGRPAPGRRVAARGGGRLRSGRSTCAAAATWAWADGPDELVFTDAQGAPLAADGLERLPAPGALGADQPAVEHRVLHRPARRALRRRGRGGELAGTGGGGMKAALLPAYDSELVIENVAAARDHGRHGRDREGRRGGPLPHRPPHHRGHLEGEGRRRAPLHPRPRERRMGGGGGRRGDARSSPATR